MVGFAAVPPAFLLPAGLSLAIHGDCEVQEARYDMLSTSHARGMTNRVLRDFCLCGVTDDVIVVNGA